MTRFAVAAWEFVADRASPLLTPRMQSIKGSRLAHCSASVLTGAERFTPGIRHHQGRSPSSARPCQFLLLGSPSSEQLQQVVLGSDERPFHIHFLQTPQQEAT